MSVQNGCNHAPAQPVYFPSKGLPEIGGFISSLPARLAALGLVTASSGFGAMYAFTTNQGHGIVLASLAVTMAVSLEVAKPLAIVRTIEAVRSLALGRAAMLAALALVAIGYSLTAELQLMARSRADAVTARATIAQRSTDAGTAVARLRAELSALDASAPAAPTAAPACSGEWLSYPRQRAACILIARQSSEAAATHATALRDFRQARSALVNRLDTAEHEAHEAGSPIVADAGAVALAQYAAALGLTVDPDKLGSWLVLVGVLALEVGSALAGVLASPAPAMPAANDAGDMLLQPRPLLVAPVVATPAAAPASVSGRVLDLIANAGGSVRSSRRDLAARLGVPKSTVDQALAAMADAGTIKLRSGSTGTLLEMV